MAANVRARRKVPRRDRPEPATTTQEAGRNLESDSVRDRNYILGIIRRVPICDSLPLNGVAIALLKRAIAIGGPLIEIIQRGVHIDVLDLQFRRPARADVKGMALW